VGRVVGISGGDCNWMRGMPLRAGIVYMGGDMVDGMIATNRSAYASSSVSFWKLDIPRDSLPKSGLCARPGLPHSSLLR
jgi:hypothetical protein